MVLLTAGDAELASRGAPLPPVELRDPSRPSAGLLPMLRCALWRALWTDAGRAAGGGQNGTPALCTVNCPVRSKSGHKCFDTGRCALRLFWHLVKLHCLIFVSVDVYISGVDCIKPYAKHRIS